MYGESIHIDPTEVKRYKVTPVKNRFVPDIVPFGRIEEPGYYMLNIREVRRARNYGYIVEEASEEGGDDKPIEPGYKPTEEEMNKMFLIGRARIGKAGLR